jgi:hypothetical protein
LCSRPAARRRPCDNHPRLEGFALLLEHEHLGAGHCAGAAADGLPREFLVVA